MLKICSPHLSHVCSHFTVGNPKKSFSTVLLIHTSDYLCSLRRKQTVIYLPIPAENVTTLTWELQNFFIWLKVCCVLSDVGGSERASCGLSLVALKRTGCVVWHLDCQASNVIASVQSGHILNGYMLPVFFDTDQSHSTPRCAEIQLTSQQAASASLNMSIACTDAVLGLCR